MTSVLPISIATMAIRRYRGVDELGEHVASLAAAAIQSGSSLLLLPELTCVGLLWSDAQAGGVEAASVGAFYRKVLTPLYPAYCETLSGIAVHHKLTIAGASFWHEDGGVGVNTALVFTPEGGVVHQDKLHPTRGERAISTAGGNGLTTFEVAGVKCGMPVCYDVQFPEVTRLLVEQGVEVLLVPSLTDERGTKRVWHSAHARALENQLFVCVSPIVGELGIPRDYPVRAMGRAFVACPIDNRFGIEDGTYACAQDGGEGLLSVKLDLDTLRLSRSKGEVRHLSDRRPALYASLNNSLQRQRETDAVT